MLIVFCDKEGDKVDGGEMSRTRVVGVGAVLEQSLITLIIVSRSSLHVTRFQPSSQ